MLEQFILDVLYPAEMLNDCVADTRSSPQNRAHQESLENICSSYFFKKNSMCRSFSFSVQSCVKPSFKAVFTSDTSNGLLFRIHTCESKFVYGLIYIQ